MHCISLLNAFPQCTAAASTTIVTTKCVITRTRLHAHRREAPRSSQRSAPVRVYPLAGRSWRSWSSRIAIALSQNWFGRFSRSSNYPNLLLGRVDERPHEEERQASPGSPGPEPRGDPSYAPWRSWRRRLLAGRRYKSELPEPLTREKPQKPHPGEKVPPHPEPHTRGRAPLQQKPEGAQLQPEPLSGESRAQLRRWSWPFVQACSSCGASRGACRGG